MENGHKCGLTGSGGVLCSSMLLHIPSKGRSHGCQSMAVLGWSNGWFIGGAVVICSGWVVMQNVDAAKLESDMIVPWT